MIESMTGFGRGDAHLNGYSVDVEIRTVNNRYCDVFIKMPSDYQHFEAEVRAKVQNRFERGKINATIKVELSGNGKSGVKLNLELASGYYKKLTQMGRELGIRETPGFEHLLHFEDIFQSESLSEEQETAFRNCLKQALDKAIDTTLDMRKQEGRELAADMLRRVDQIRVLVEKIRDKAPERVGEARTKLNERIEAILTEDQYDTDRLETEIALLADKLDITEELVRLDSHLKFFTETVDGNQSGGRKLNFLLQEMLREVNTIGSKAYHAEIAHFVVDIKESIEIIREQVQNIV